MCNIFIWNWSNTINVKSALWILMAWYFTTRASVATVLTTHPCISRCLGVKLTIIRQWWKITSHSYIQMLLHIHVLTHLVQVINAAERGHWDICATDIICHHDNFQSIETKLQGVEWPHHYNIWQAPNNIAAQGLFNSIVNCRLDIPITQLLGFNTSQACHYIRHLNVPLSSLSQWAVPSHCPTPTGPGVKYKWGWLVKRTDSSLHQSHGRPG